MLADLDLKACQPHLVIVACYKILANKTAAMCASSPLCHKNLIRPSGCIQQSQKVDTLPLHHSGTYPSNGQWTPAYSAICIIYTDYCLKNLHGIFFPKSHATFILSRVT